MNTFPTLSTGPKIEGFTDEYSDEAVVVADPSMGYPNINEEFAFNPRNFSYALQLVSQANKEAIEAFYQANKNVTFNWLNEQENVTYEVVFMAKPYCQLDGSKNQWKILLNLRQAGE